MANNGKLEARITIPTGGWAVDLTDQDAGPTTVTIPAGTYYHSTADSTANDLVAEFASQANAAMGQTWTVTIAAGESGTGKVTIGCTGTTCTINFTTGEIALSELLGFPDTGSALSGSTSYTSPDQAQAIWLPISPPQVLNGGDSGWQGHWETDQQIKETAHGNVFSVMGRDKRIIDDLMWAAQTRAKTWRVDEETVNASFEQFMRDGIHGIKEWGTSTGPIRWYPDADTDGTSVHLSAVGFRNWRPNIVRSHFVGRWDIAMRRLVQVP